MKPERRVADADWTMAGRVDRQAAAIREAERTTADDPPSWINRYRR